MLKRNIKYTDFNGVDRNEDFYFNLTKAELMQLELSENGGFKETLKAIINAKDIVSLNQIFKKIILAAYGEKSVDGKRFIKTDENGKPLSLAFSETAAFSELYMELATDDEKASEFINGIVPKDIRPSEADMKKMEKELENE